MSPLIAAPGTEPPQRALLRIAPFALIIFCVYLTIGMPLAAIPLQVHDVLGFDNLTVGITIGVQSLVTLVTRQSAGSLCDRRGAKFGVLLGGAAAIAASAIYTASALPTLGAYESLGVLVAARAISGLAESLVMTGSLAWGIAAAGSPNTGKVMVWIGIGMYAAIAVGGPIGVNLATHRHFIGGFADLGLVMIAVSALATALAAAIRGVAPHGGERLAFMKVVGRIAPYGAGLALATIGFGAIGAFAALDFQHNGWPGAGFALTGFGAAYVFTRVVFGGWPDRFGGARVAAWSLLVACAGQVALWLAPGPGVAFAGAILTGAGYSLVFPSFGIEAMKQVPPASRGAALGAYVAFFDVGFGVAGPITGAIAGALGYPSVFAAGAVGTLAALSAARRWHARGHAATTRA
ncbi:MAG TPA: MFS transporter [Xanthobacteraceae bacterium]|nr:MFS transporter [Xanthobacteraceae bacterium]